MQDQVHTLKPPQPIFRKTVSIDIQSPLSQDQKDQFFKEQKFGVTFSSPPNSDREKCIPDEEVISYFIPDDNQSQTSFKFVRFSEPQEKTTNIFVQKYRRQRSIPFPEKVQEDLIGESSQLSPYNKTQIRIKDRLQYINQSTNLLHQNQNQVTINAIKLNNRFKFKMLSSCDQCDQINQIAEELVNLIKNFLNDISFEEDYFTFDEREIDDCNTKQIQRAILKKALENINCKLNLRGCSPIQKIPNILSNSDDIKVNQKDLEFKIEELIDQNDLLNIKFEIQDLKLLEQYSEIQSLKIKIADLELQNKSYQVEIENKNQDILSLNEQLLQLSKQLDNQIKIQQIQSSQIQLLEQKQKLTEKQSNQEYLSQKLNNSLNKCFKREKKQVNSFHEVCSSHDGNKLMIVNSSTNSSRQSPRNIQNSNNQTLNLNDTTYFGSIYNEKRQGYGNLKKGDKKLYMGFWKDDIFNGFGFLKNETVEQGIIDYINLDSVGNKWISYQGEFQDGLFNGYGIWTFVDNSRFHGTFQLGKACGRGVYYTNINTIYGIWNKNIKL